ncbi:hypothetical protein BJY00DRAFT_120079 [Aspergillus carlsbadensis]|nr:hypothetical protein BJY00DRAFT_120079 [Aspergillus carlsbadensis]
MIRLTPKDVLAFARHGIPRSSRHAKRPRFCRNRKIVRVTMLVSAKKNPTHRPTPWVRVQGVQNGLSWRARATLRPLSFLPSIRPSVSLGSRDPYSGQSPTTTSFFSGFQPSPAKAARQKRAGRATDPSRSHQGRSSLETQSVVVDDQTGRQNYAFGGRALSIILPFHPHVIHVAHTPADARRKTQHATRWFARCFPKRFHQQP